MKRKLNLHSMHIQHPITLYFYWIPLMMVLILTVAHWHKFYWKKWILSVFDINFAGYGCNKLLLEHTHNISVCEFDSIKDLIDLTRSDNVFVWLSLLIIYLHWYTVKPVHAVTSIKQCIKVSHFSCPVLENFIWIEPLLRGHLF